ANDTCQATDDSVASFRLPAQFDAAMLGLPQPFAKCGVALLRRGFKAGDGALRDLGGSEQLRDCRLERVLVSLEALEPTIEHHAVANGDQQQKGDQAFDHESNAVVHDASIRLVDPSAPSNMASVVRGLRRGLATRTAMRSPTRPMRPSVSTT